MTIETELSRRLKDYWLNANRTADDSVAIIAAALEEPPDSAATVGRVLQVIDEVDVAPAWSEPIEAFRVRSRSLYDWRRQVDTLGDADTPVLKVLEYVEAGGEQGVPQAELSALLAARVGARSRAEAAGAVLDQLGRHRLDATSRAGLETAIDDLVQRSKHFHAEALFVEEEGARGFVLGVQVLPNDSTEIRPYADVGQEMKAQAEIALRKVLQQGGCEWTIEW